MKNNKKIEVENFDDCNTSFTPNVARKSLVAKLGDGWTIKKFFFFTLKDFP